MAEKVYCFPFSMKQDITVTSVEEFKRTWIVPAIMLEMGKNYWVHLYDDGTGYIEEATNESIQRQKARKSIHRAGSVDASSRLCRAGKQQGPVH